MKKQKQEETINWFGKPMNKKTQSKPKSNSVSYLGMGTGNIPQKVNFFGLNQKKHQMTPSSLFKKESIKKKRLSKWGDADMDGTPNYFDCDARNVFKDALSLKSLKKKASEYISKRKPYSPLEEREKKSERAMEKRQKTKEKYERDMDEDAIKQIEKEDIGAKKREKKIETSKERTERVKELLKGTGLAGRSDIAKYTIEEAQAAGKKPKEKDIAKLAKIERRMKKIGDIEQEGRISRDILTKVPGGEIGRVITGAGITKTGEYSKALKAKSARVRRMTKFAAGAVFGPSLTQTHFDSEPRGRGRPPGPSGEYKIGGKPVYEEEFQQYAIKQSALNRMLPSQQQSATLNPEYAALIKAQKAAERGETQTVMTEEGMPMEGEVSNEQEGYPTTGTSMMQTGQQQIDIRDKRAYTRATPDEIKEAQSQAQKMDNPLNAPNFMRGELKATGGSLLTPIGPSILEAPKVFQGEMRNVVQSNPEEGEIKLSERPQTNPYGDEYLEIELGSGRPVLKKRIKEKWMTGEAL